MPIKIHGKEYITVAERVKAIHEAEDNIGITTEVLRNDPVVVKAIVTCKKGVFSGISAANPAKAIEKTNPYEVAETSAVGRALGFANYGLIESIASADEMVKADVEAPKTTYATNQDEVPKCPRCGGEMWDNRKNKRNPKAPDFKCKNENCKDDKGYVTSIWHKHKELPEQQADDIEDRNDDSAKDEMKMDEPPMPTDQEIDIEDIPFN